MAKVTDGDWVTTAADITFELPKPASLTATIDDETVERRKVARPLAADQRVNETMFSTGPGKLLGQVAIVSSGNEELRCTMALMLSGEGAEVAIIYETNQEASAQALVSQVEMTGKRALAIGGDRADSEFCKSAAEVVAGEFGKIDLVITTLQ